MYSYLERAKELEAEIVENRRTIHRFGGTGFDIQETSDFLMVILQMLFIPAAASIMNYVGVIRDNFVPLIVVCVASLFITFAATAYAVQLTIRLMEKRREKAEERREKEGERYA